MHGTTSPTPGLTLSVVVPVYNERYLVAELLRRVLAVQVPGVAALEVIVIDDASTDGTREVLRAFVAAEPRIKYIEQASNGGKGTAVQTGIAHATGDLIVFQDADLEYDPRDYARLVRPFLEDEADVVYGSRFLPSERRRVLYYRHSLGNKLLTTLTNWFTDLNLTDMETCYKMFRAPLLKSIPIRSARFGMEPEITMKVAKRNCRLFEVPISYMGRTYQEGKKIGWKDGVSALWTILKYWLKDDIYVEDAAGLHTLRSLERARNFNRWMADSIRPHVGARVLEVGAGIGNMTNCLVPRDTYVASDVNPEYLAVLKNFAFARPYMGVEQLDLERPAQFDPFVGQFDTVVCLNVLEHVKDPLGALSNMRRALVPGGRLIVYVPQGPSLYSNLDRALEHRRRYTEAALRQELEATGFLVERIEPFNRLSTPGWWLRCTVLGSSRLSALQIRLLNMAVPFMRHVDRFLPFPPLGLIAVGIAPPVATVTSASAAALVTRPKPA
ncbi:MAG: glycosyltransferase [Vicinamibacterales bacterium]